MHAVLPSSKYQPDIQGLRAVAVLLVVYYHVGFPGLPGGYIGVDVFFVISGYLITGLLLREIDRKGTISLAKFYARRARRLLPAAALVLLSTMAFAWFFYSPLELKQFSSSAFATSIYMSNVWFAHLSTDYLAEDTDANPLLHTWSLAVEEQFYLVWPFLLLLTLHAGRPERLRWRLKVVFLAVVVVSFGASVFLTGYSQPWAFFGSPTRAWEFAVGGLVALAVVSGAQIGLRSGVIMGAAGLGMIVAAAVWYSRATLFPGWAAVLPMAGTALVLMAANRNPLSGANRFLALPIMQFIGNISYSLYLWHWPVFVFGAEWIEQHGFAGQVGAVLLVVLLAWLSLVLVENPIRFNKALARKSRHGLASAATLTASVCILALGVRHSASAALDQTDQRLFLAADRESPIIYSNGCHLGFLEVDQPECRFGDPDGRNTMVLFGDSHAAQWFPVLNQFAKAEGWRLYSFTKSACPSALFERFSTVLNRDYVECSRWRSAVLERIVDLNPNLVVFANSNGYVRGALPGADKLSRWRTGTQQALAALKGTGADVVLVRDTPRPRNSVPRCLSSADWLGRDLGASCPIENLPLDQDRVFAAERDAAQHVGEIRMLDLNSIICPDQPCEPVRDGYVLYRDASHLTVSFAQSLVPAIKGFLVEEGLYR